VIKRRRCAAPCPAALRARRAAPTAPTRRGMPGHPRISRWLPASSSRWRYRVRRGRLPRRISVPVMAAAWRRLRRRTRSLRDPLTRPLPRIRRLPRKTDQN